MAIRELELETKRVNTVRELEKTISGSLAKQNFVEAEKGLADLLKLDMEKARPLEESIQTRKAERVKELSESIYRSLEEGNFLLVSNQELCELDGLDTSEAEKVRTAIEAKKAVFINYLAQTVEYAISEKRFDDAEKTAGELGTIDSLKSAECMKNIKDAKDYYIRQLERSISDCLEQDRFEDANEFLGKLTDIGTSKAKTWEDKIQVSQLEFVFQNALKEKRFEDANENVQTLNKRDPQKAEILKKALDIAISEHARQLKQRINEASGNENFNVALDLVRELSLINTAEGQEFEAKVKSRLTKHVHKKEKAFNHALKKKDYTEAQKIIDIMEAIDLEKAQKWNEEIKKKQNEPSVSYKYICLKCLFVCLFVCLGVLSLFYIFDRKEIDDILISFFSIYYNSGKSMEMMKGEAKERRKAWEKEAKVIQKAKAEKIFDVTSNMVKIKAGSFMMGSPTNEEGRNEDEIYHEVNLSQDFWLGKCEVTQIQYATIMGKNPSSYRGGGNFPVTNVSWYDAMIFCKKLTERERAKGILPAGYEYSLPTEAQWEYACRAGTKTAWNCGDKLINANFGRKGWTEAGVFRPNAWGLHDMHGSVQEWCRDYYGSYSEGYAVDPMVVTSGFCRVVRGGGNDSNALHCRSAARSGLNPNSCHQNTGFRIALVPVQ